MGAGGFLVDFFFPPRCGGCGARGSWFCDHCRAQVHPLPASGCLRCGRATVILPCPLCDAVEPPLDGLHAAVRLDGPVREAVHRLKYGDRPRLGRELASLFGDWQPPAPGAVLVPVPLGARRRRQRGYNQAEELARGLASERGLQLAGAALARERETAPQVGRGGDERRQALVDAFRWRGHAAPAVVVLVDDVVTTGATLLECGRACRRGGAIRVHGLGLALG